jgi:hypothetical protein
MSFFSMAGRAGATTGTISIGPVYTHTTDVMSSSRDHNTKDNTGGLPRGTNWLALFVQKKFDRLFRRKDPVAFKPGSSLHLLTNRELGGYFDYQAYDKYRLSRQKRSNAKPAKSELANSSMPRVNMKEVRVESPMDESRPIAQGSSRELIKEMLLRALPGLEADHEDWLSPTKERVKKAKASFERRIERLEKNLQELKETNASAALINDVNKEKARCEHCHGILDNVRKRYEDPSRRNRSEFWRRNLETRWKKMHANDPDNQDLFALVRKVRDVDAIAKQHHFIFLPQELCLLEMEIAVEELSDIDGWGVLDAEQFGDLIEALAHGWPGVQEDSQSPMPEDRANAAGCVRALAQLANKGKLPREVLSSFREFDAINLALL